MREISPTLQNVFIFLRRYHEFFFETFYLLKFPHGQIFKYEKYIDVKHIIDIYLYPYTYEYGLIKKEKKEIGADNDLVWLTQIITCVIYH